MNQEPHHPTDENHDICISEIDLAIDPDLLMLRNVLLNEVRADRRDLSLRQMAVLLTIYLTNEPQTVRGLAAHLKVPGSAITRVFDQLCELGLMRRKVDLQDLRNVLGKLTPHGIAWVKELEAAMVAAAAGSKQ